MFVLMSCELYFTTQEYGKENVFEIHCLAVFHHTLKFSLITNERKE